MDDKKINEIVHKVTGQVLDTVYEQIEQKLPEHHHKPGFLASMMSIDEMRVSALMICLLISLAFGGYAYLEHGDISERWAGLIETFIYCVTGINMLATINPRSRLAKVLSNLADQAESKTAVKKEECPSQSPQESQSSQSSQQSKPQQPSSLPHSSQPSPSPSHQSPHQQPSQTLHPNYPMPPSYHRGLNNSNSNNIDNKSFCVVDSDDKR